MAFSEVTDDIERVAGPPGTQYSFNANAGITAGQVVKLTGDNQVEPSDTDGETVVGVAMQTVSSGDNLHVAGSGTRVLLTAGASGVSAGDPLTSHGGTGENGQVNTGDEAGDYLLGFAHEGVSAQGDTLVATLDLGGEVNA